MCNMNKVKIFVACHKPSEVFHNDVYVPLHVGRTNSAYNEDMQWMIGDNTGDNISKKNRHYSEATGIYWIWKNVHDCEYVGLTHYRRTFKPIFTNENIDSYFQDGTDVILAKKFLRLKSRLHTILTCVQAEDFIIMRDVLKKLYPDYLLTLNRFLRDYLDHPFNMVVCRKEIYDQYSAWMFSICFEMEKYVRYSNYSNSARLFAYVTELLTPVFFIHNKCKIKEISVVKESVEIKDPLINRVYAFIMHNTIFRIRKDVPIEIDASFMRGLKQDGIDIK